MNPFAVPSSGELLPSTTHNVSDEIMFSSMKTSFRSSRRFEHRHKDLQAFPRTARSFSLFDFSSSVFPTYLIAIFVFSSHVLGYIFSPPMFNFLSTIWCLNGLN
ncbi:hypothetical protein B9Z55_009795 [Caenorhabditis nigoni]|uniref:Uncharacterized protein n=1 Tax=Caenorhabditis nigoni TaxID=1611254 RepID=A0A2G5UTG5_9PELO|nr:hypothetical protein B9Z55_009795 [Caenorhabditis nigoni]